MELQPADSLRLIQDIIRQRKQKYEENGFFLIFWSVLIALSGIILTYSVLFFHYGIALPLLSAVLACLLFLIPGIQFYTNYKKQMND